LFIAAALLFVLLPRTGEATSITYEGTGRGSLVQIAVSGLPFPYNSGTWITGKNVWGGEYKWNFAGGGPNEFPDYDSTFYTYCIELLNSTGGGGDVAIRSTNLLTVAGVPNAGGKAAWLFNTYSSVIRAMPYTTTAEQTNANQSAAALQVAIWEALLDSSNSLTGGTFRLTANSLNNGITTKAMAYLSSLYSGGPSGYNTGTATWLDMATKQDQIFLPGVPEPGSILLLGTGLVGMVVVRRRRRRAPSA
jgi:hypothetical protein